MSQNALSLRQYFRYFLIGGGIGVASVALLEALTSFLPIDTPLRYGLAVGLVYVTGVLTGFSFHSRYTFLEQATGRPQRQITGFAMISLLGALLTSVLSTILRFALDLDRVIGRHASTAAFIAAALVASILTYWLNARLIFARTQKK